MLHTLLIVFVKILIKQYNFLSLQNYTNFKENDFKMFIMQITNFDFKFIPFHNLFPHRSYI